MIKALIKLDDYVLLLSPEKRKTWLAKVEHREFHTHLGMVDLGALEGLEWGSEISTNKGKRLVLLKPTLEDFVMKFERRTQIVYPKDAGLILIKLNVKQGDRILEIGTGSGAMTAFLANAVAPTGKVVTYEVRKDFQEMARRNLEKTELIEYIDFVLADATRGVDGGPYDAAMVDVGDPWDLVGKVHEVLKPSASLAAIAPTMNQAERLVQALKDEGFTMLECFELLYRRIEARPGKTRPTTQMIGHTAYVICARKALK